MTCLCLLLSRYAFVIESLLVFCFVFGGGGHLIDIQIYLNTLLDI